MREHLAAVIEKTVASWQEAETGLGRLTHDAANERIGNDIVIPNVYLLHLPKDIMSRLPYIELNSSPTGAAPNFLSPTAIFEFVWNCLVAIGTALANLASSLVQAGISYYSNLWNAVTTVVTVIVNAFNAFVQWAIEFVQNILSAMVGSFVNAISAAFEGYYNGVLAAIELAKSEQNSPSGIVSAATIAILVSALDGGLFDTFFQLSVVLELALLAVTVVTNIFGFLIGVIGSMVMGLLFDQIFSASSIPQEQVVVEDEDVQGIIQDGQFDMSACRNFMSMVGAEEPGQGDLGFGVIDAAVSQWVLKIQAFSLVGGRAGFGKVSLAIGIMAMALSIGGTVMHNEDLSRLSIVVGATGLAIDILEALYSIFVLDVPMKKMIMEGCVLLLNIGAIGLSLYMSYL